MSVLSGGAHPLSQDDKIELGIMEVLPLIEPDETASQALPLWVRAPLRPAVSAADALWRGRCPFCGRAQFYAQRLVWKCVGCKREGNVIDFYCHMDGWTRPVALRAALHKCMVDNLL